MSLTHYKMFSKRIFIVDCGLIQSEEEEVIEEPRTSWWCRPYTVQTTWY